MLPEAVAAKGYSIEDWRDFLYFMADYLRSYFALDVDDGDARWMPGRARPRNVIGPDQPPGSKRGILWPSVNTQGEIGRAHVCTPVTNADFVCRLMLEKKKELTS